ncbi:MAG: glycosyltransferase family 1 protein [Patescibacteria group bacterium]
MSNIAFEISPLLLASGTFGDKSGVYRYYYGLIKSYGEYIKKQKINEKIILFSFNRDLLNWPTNKEILDLINNDVFIFINKVPMPENKKKYNFEIVKGLPKLFLKIINVFVPIKKIYFNIINRIRFNEYMNALDIQLKRNKVIIIYHSETCFFPLKGYKNIITIFDLTPIIMSYFHRKETNDLTNRKLTFASKYCQGIVCISQSTKNDLTKIFPIFKSKKIVTCYPGIEPVFTKSQPLLFDEINTIVSQYAKNILIKKYLLFYSTFEPRKNVINLIQAFYELQKNLQIPADFKLVLLGGTGWGKVRQQVTNFIKENFPIKDKNKIILLDFINDNYLVDLIKNAYAVVYPSYYEGFGLPVLESMSLGTPVICSNTSSLPEVGGDSVLYINPNDYYDIKEKIKYLVNHPAVAKKIGDLGRIQSNKFNWEKSVSQLRKFLVDL